MTGLIFGGIILSVYILLERNFLTKATPELIDKVKKLKLEGKNFKEIHETLLGEGNKKKEISNALVIATSDNKFLKIFNNVYDVLFIIFLVALYFEKITINPSSNIILVVVSGVFIFLNMYIPFKNSIQ